MGIIEDIREGAGEVFVGAVFGIVLVAIYGLILTQLNVSSDFLSLFKLVDLLGSIFIIYQFENWGVGYLAGWLLGTYILSYFKIIENWLFALYFIIGIFVLLERFLNILDSIPRMLKRL